MTVVLSAGIMMIISDRALGSVRVSLAAWLAGPGQPLLNFRSFKKKASFHCHSDTQPWFGALPRTSYVRVRVSKGCLLLDWLISLSVGRLIFKFLNIRTRPGGSQLEVPVASERSVALGPG